MKMLGIEFISKPQEPKTVADIQQINEFFTRSGKNCVARMDSDNVVKVTDMDRAVVLTLDDEQYDMLNTKVISYLEALSTDVMKDMLN